MTSKKIAISGDLGSGKSVTSKYIAEKLGYQYISTGEIQRQMAREKGISVLEMNKLADINSEVDKKIDETLIQINKSDGGYILDSRLAWFFVSTSLKIYLRTNLEITINRILFDKKRTSELYASREIARTEIIERKASENARFLIEYGIDCGNLSNYDLVIETTSVMPPDIGDTIIWLSQQESKEQLLSRNWVSPKFLFPTKSIKEFSSEKTAAALAQEPFDLTNKITCIYYEGYYFVVDGHKRASIALAKNIPLLPVDIITSENQPSYLNNLKDHIQEKYNRAFIHEWEDLHNFRFEIYPQLDFIPKL